MSLKSFVIHASMFFFIETLCCCLDAVGAFMCLGRDVVGKPLGNIPILRYKSIRLKFGLVILINTYLI